MANSSHRGHGEGTLEWDRKRECYFVKVTYKDPMTGETKRKKLKGTQTKAASLKIGQQWLENLEGGLLPGTDKTTLWEWLERWLQDYVKQKVRVKSYDKYEGCLRCYVKPQLGNVQIGKLKSPDVQRLLNKLLNEGGKNGNGISTSTVKATRRYLSMALEQAVKAGLVIRNVVKDTIPPKLTKKEICLMTKEQVTALLCVAKQKGQVPYIVILLALSTGMRLGEIFGLQWDCVDLERGVVFVRRSLITGRKLVTGQWLQEPKTQKSKRQIPLPDKVTEELRIYKTWQEEQIAQLGDKYENNNFVVANMFGRPVDTSNFTTRHFKAMLVDAGIDRSIKFHDLRHTHATLLLLEGINPKIVQERLGHSTVTMTLDTYSHLLPDMQDTAVKALEGLFRESSTGYSVGVQTSVCIPEERRDAA
ncbi:tyrosine-type recombinase/integrase [Sporomusa sphaeroides]|uniref:Transposase from transposon Tn916 n=1 Tax=Sporomusa sphaeroides DSM 2875 TaxID=1337886 RepID=A0ABM9W0L2_9FIRM|nr:site-specific integrase [Sporomusa sphaeroides]OLS56306.1 transposase from transposon Tn916 [Sporomusa sphaeroides DSM 2875]CVK18401.1 Transposase from transposon Tn916 [Sporomusa sphaeroides DSM 2875]